MVIKSIFFFLYKYYFILSVQIFLDVLGTVDYVDQSDGTIVFRTCSLEKGKVVLQIGTCDPERALKVGQLVYVVC